MRIIAGTARSLPLKTIEGWKRARQQTRSKRHYSICCRMMCRDVIYGSVCGQRSDRVRSNQPRSFVCSFIENNRKAAKCIEDNIAFTKFTKESRLLTTDVISGISSLEGKYTFDIILYPPYRQGLEEDVLRFLSKSSVLKPDTMIIVEASLDTDFSYLDELGFSVIKFKKYKTNMHVFIQQKRV